jgi:hypothetical protein
MSNIVPREVVEQWNNDWYAMQALRPSFRDYIANRAAEWALEQALKVCTDHGAGHLSAPTIDEYYSCDGAKSEACEGVADAIRALIKGGE